MSAPTTLAPRPGLIVTLPDGTSGQVVKQWDDVALVRRHTPDETGSDLRAYPMAVLVDWRLPTPRGGAR